MTDRKTVSEAKELRDCGKRLAKMLWTLGSSQQRDGNGGHLSLLELNPEAARELNELLRKVWDVFDTADIVPISPTARAYSEARQDSAFQDFLVGQGLRAVQRTGTHKDC